MSLTRSQWSEVEALFDQAYELPEAERARWLEGQERGRASDSGVYDKVRAPLAASGQAFQAPGIKLISREAAAEPEVLRRTLRPLAPAAAAWARSTWRSGATAPTSSRWR